MKNNALTKALIKHNIINPLSKNRTYIAFNRKLSAFEEAHEEFVNIGSQHLEDQDAIEQNYLKSKKELEDYVSKIIQRGMKK